MNANLKLADSNQFVNGQSKCSSNSSTSTTETCCLFWFCKSANIQVRIQFILYHSGTGQLLIQH